MNTQVAEASAKQILPSSQTLVQLVEGGVSALLRISLMLFRGESLVIWHLNTCLYALRKFSDRKA